ncbi:Beta-conglycinin, beta chain [Glycine soja]
MTSSKDNVIRQIQRQVKELAFPAGSAQHVQNLIKNERKSYFADAQPLDRHDPYNFGFWANLLREKLLGVSQERTENDIETNRPNNVTTKE